VEAFALFHADSPPNTESAWFIAAIGTTFAVRTQKEWQMASVFQHRRESQMCRRHNGSADSSVSGRNNLVSEPVNFRTFQAANFNEL
jgi:hypothetical protein